MIAGIKKCIDTGDIKGLRYIFLDSLDVDPTFENYKEDYAVCRNLEGMFESYVEMNDLSSDKANWNMDYWGRLKYDQKKNFSEKRFEHMMEVAKIVHAEKIERLLVERAAKQSKIEEQIEQVIPKTPASLVQPQVIQNMANSSNGNYRQDNMTSSDKIRIDESKRAIDLHNQKVAQEEYEKQCGREAAAKEIEGQNALLEAQNQPKKVPGIVVTIAVIVIVVVVVLLLKVL